MKLAIIPFLHQAISSLAPASRCDIFGRRVVANDPLFARKMKHARVTCNKDTVVLQRAEFKMVMSKACQCCSVGDRVAIPQRLDCGTTVLQTGTVMRQHEQAAYMIKIDQDESMVPVNLLRQVVLRSARFEYGPQKPLVVYYRRRWRDVVVQKCISLNENKYECFLGTAAPTEEERMNTTKMVHFHLNEANHMPAIISIASAEMHLRGEFAGYLRKESEFVVDEVTDLKLRTDGLEISIEYEGSAAFAGRPLRTVNDLVEYLARPGDYFASDAEHCDISSARKLCRLANEHWRPRKQQKRPIMIQADRGKSWLVSRLQWLLSSEERGRAVNICVPVVMNVQEFVVGRNNIDSGKRKKLSIEWLIDFKAKDWHKDKFLSWQYLLQTAFALRWTVVIIDGIDEAAGLREEIDRFVWMLIHGGYQVVLTCRPQLTENKKRGGGERGTGGARTEGPSKRIETAFEGARGESVGNMKSGDKGGVTTAMQQRADTLAKDKVLSEQEGGKGEKVEIVDEYKEFVKIQIGPFSPEALDRKMSEHYECNHIFFNEHLFDFIALRKHMDHLYEVQCRKDGELILELSDIRTHDCTQVDLQNDPVITQLDLYAAAQKALPMFRREMKKIMIGLVGKEAVGEKLLTISFERGGEFSKEEKGEQGKLSRVVFATAEEAWAPEDGEMMLRGWHALEKVIYKCPETGEKISNFDTSRFEMDPSELDQLRMNGKPFTVKTKMNGLAKVTNLIESYIMCSSCTQMLQLLDRIKGHTNFEIVHLENLFLPQNNTRDHYRMLKLKIRVKTNDGTTHVVQLEVHALVMCCPCHVPVLAPHTPFLSF
jgi:hypothetical protein